MKFPRNEYGEPIQTLPDTSRKPQHRSPVSGKSQYTVLRYFLALLRSGNDFAIEQLHDAWIHYDKGRAQLADALEAALLKIRALEPDAIPEDLFDSLPFQSILHIPDKH